MKPKLRQDIYIRAIKDEKAVYDKHTDSVHFLNQTASFIIELCDGSHTKEDMVSRLLEKYDVPKETADKDVENILKALHENNVLEKDVQLKVQN